MKNAIVILLMVVIPFATTAQDLRHVRGQSYMGITYGKSKSTNLAGVNYTYFLRNKIALEGNGMFEIGQFGETKLNNYTIDLGAFYTVYKLKNTLYFNLGGSFITGLEGKKSSETLEKMNNFIYGFIGHLSIECFITSKIIAKGKIQETWIINSDLGKFYPVYSITIGYVF